MPGIKLTFENIAEARNLRAARITLDRAPLNILDIRTICELHKALTAVQHEPRTAAIVLSHEGPNFSAGVEVRDHERANVREMLSAFHGVFRVLARMELLTFCAIRGLCLGGGCELAIFCDFVVASEDAQLGFPEIRLACFPPVAAVVLPRLIGEKRALDLVLTGERISAVRASELGLVTMAAGDVEVALRSMMAQVFSNSGLALRKAKRAVRLGFADEFDERLRQVEKLYLDELVTAADTEEGIRAFLEKRPPRWRDE